MSNDDGVTVTENEPRAHRPDSTAEQAAAESRSEQVVKDLDAGLVSKPGVVRVRLAADRALRNFDLQRGIKALP